MRPQIQIPYCKTNKPEVKRTEAVGQMVEHLPILPNPEFKPQNKIKQKPKLLKIILGRNYPKNLKDILLELKL
jgi:hypothetical protein